MKDLESGRLNDGSAHRSISVRDISLVPALDGLISVRSAKAHLSSLLDLVEQGREVVITSKGKPKARLVPVEAGSNRGPFAFSPGFVAAPLRGGATADEIIREDRNGRGW